jgi:hypothetical protein
MGAVAADDLVAEGLGDSGPPFKRRMKAILPNQGDVRFE